MRCKDCMFLKKHSATYTYTPGEVVYYCNKLPLMALCEGIGGLYGSDWDVLGMDEETINDFYCARFKHKKEKRTR